MGSGAPSNTTQTSIQQLPAWLNNANTFGAQQAQNLYNQGGPAYYPGNTVAPFSPMQEQYFSGVENLAQNGTPIENSATNQMTQTLGGSYLDPSSNPYLQDTFNQAANGVQNRLSTEFASQGRNPSMSLGAQADAMNHLATDIYGGNYQAERANQMKALAYSPAMDQMGLTGLNALNSAGGMLQNQAQNMQGQSQNLYNYYAGLPWTNLNNFMNTVNSLSHGGSSSVTGPGPQGPNRTMSALGGAASGAVAGGAIGSAIAGGETGSAAGPWGTAIGAGLGLLSGYFM